MKNTLVLLGFIFHAYAFPVLACEGSCSENLQKIFRLSEPKEVIKPLQGSTVVSFLPQTDSEFKAIYSEPPSARKLAESVRANERLRKSFSSEKFLSPPNDDEGFGQVLQDARTDYIVIIGHNDDGSFVMPSGNSYSLTSMDGQCIEFKVRCIFISCSAAQYLDVSAGAIEDIPPEQAFLIAKRLEQRLAEADSETLNREFIGGALQSVVSAMETRTRREMKVKEIGTQAGAGFVVVGGAAAATTGGGDGKSQSGVRP